MRLRASAAAVAPLIAVLAAVGIAACSTSGQSMSGQHRPARHQQAGASGEQAAGSFAKTARSARGRSQTRSSARCGCTVAFPHGSPREDLDRRGRDARHDRAW
jgi:hypothetical protein